MDASARLIRVTLIVLTIAAWAAFGAAVIRGQVSGHSLFQGISDDRVAYLGLRRADGATAAVSETDAVARAIEAGVSPESGTAPTVRDALLLWHRDVSFEPPKDRLVWAISFDDPAAVLGARQQRMGPNAVLADVEFAIVLVDGDSGRYLMTAEGGRSSIHRLASSKAQAASSFTVFRVGGRRGELHKVPRRWTSANVALDCRASPISAAAAG